MEQPINPVVAPLPPVPNVSYSYPSLMSFEELYKSTFEVYKKLFVKITFYPLGAYFLGALPLIFILVIWGGVQFIGLPTEIGRVVNVLLGFLGLVGVIVMMLSMFLSLQIPYLLISKNSTANLKELLLEAKKNLLPFAGVIVLYTLVVLGGFILLIIPGFYFLIRYIFAPLAYMFEDYGGSSALKRSSELVSGNWWGIAMRLMSFYGLIWVFSFVVGTIASVAGPEDSVAYESIMVLGNLVSYLASPIYLIMTAILYRDLAQKIGTKKIKKKASSIGLAAVLIFSLIPIIGIVSTLAVVSLNNARMKSRDARIISDVKFIQSVAELYFNDNGKYPTSLSELESTMEKNLDIKSDVYTSFGVNPATNEKYKYLSTDSDYRLCFNLEDEKIAIRSEFVKGENCLTKAGLSK